MPEITAFRAWRYNPEQFGPDLSEMVALPYDVLTAEDKQRLLSRSERNIVAVDLPFVPPKSAGPDHVYAEAAERLNVWREDGTLMVEDEPAIYVYHQIYEHGGKQYTRKKFFARLRLEPFGQGGVFPHEHTFGGPKEDRLKLMQATSFQLSAVFGLYSDPHGAVARLLEPGSRKPDATAELDTVTNRMWAVTDPAIIKAVQQEMSTKPVYIADGHHRYGTALNYRDKRCAAGELPMDHPARFVLVGLCAMEDPGALILPTHRIISGFGDLNVESVLGKLRDGLKLEPAAGTPADFDTILPQTSPYDLAVWVDATKQMFLARFSERGILDQLAPEQSPAWRNLDLAYIHTYLLDELLTRDLLGGSPPTVHYARSGADADNLVRHDKGIALICKACTMEDLRGVSQAGDLMPQKSTFFYPKLATGLVLNPLD
ncbi:MAG: DUF1015 domain-containing protein [Phycisphaerales bacterium]|nr:DUF1015 domain-containing protein [Phycisphaerales bacterium]